MHITTRKQLERADISHSGLPEYLLRNIEFGSKVFVAVSLFLLASLVFLSVIF